MICGVHPFFLRLNSYLRFCPRFFDTGGPIISDRIMARLAVAGSRPSSIALAGAASAWLFFAGCAALLWVLPYPALLPAAALL